MGPRTHSLALELVGHVGEGDPGRPISSTANVSREGLEKCMFVYMVDTSGPFSKQSFPENTVRS